MIIRLEMAAYSTQIIVNTPECTKKISKMLSTKDLREMDVVKYRLDNHMHGKDLLLLDLGEDSISRILVHGLGLRSLSFG